MIAMPTSSEALAASEIPLSLGIHNPRNDQAAVVRIIGGTAKTHQTNERESEIIENGMRATFNGNELKSTGSLIVNTTLGMIVRTLVVVMAMATLTRVSEGMTMMSNQWRPL